MMRKLRLVNALVLLLGIFAWGGGHAIAAPSAQAGPTTWTVLTGGEAEIEQTDIGPAGAWQFMRFYPAKITINVGDTILWKINSGEFHTVNFPAPGKKDVPFTIPQGQNVLLNPEAALPSGGPNYDGTAAAGSGLVGKGPQQAPQYKLTFTKAGTYNYVCAIHSALNPATGEVVGMVGSVTVQAAGSAYPQTQAQIDAAGKALLASDTQAAMAAEPQAEQVQAPQAGPNGNIIYNANVGFDQGIASYMRFAPTDMTIHVGDTITWKQTSTVTPHTVSLTSGAPEPDLVVAQPQSAGPPTLMLNPLILAPAGGTSYAGTGYFNSGFMPGTQDPAPGPRTYSLTFSTPGTYEYVCFLHDEIGMNGHITVLAAGSTPGMPSTGKANAWELSLFVLFGLVLICGGIALQRRRADEPS